MSEFFNMGGYAFYVWASYGATALMLLGLFVSSVLKSQKTKKQLMRLEQDHD